MRAGPIALAAAAALVAGPALAEDAPDLVTVVTAEHAQTQLMAMVLTAQAVEQGKRVHMLLCGPGGDIALKDAPETATTGQPPRDASPQKLLLRIMEGGATVEVCAIYLPGAGLEADALLDGVMVAEPPAMAARMLGEGVTVWSF